MHPFSTTTPKETTMSMNRRTALQGATALALAASIPLAFAQKKITLGFSQIGAESEWRTANTESIKSAAKDTGINLKFADAQQKQENQIKAIRSFIAQKVDVIAFSPVVETGFETVLKEAKAAKIPVILTDRSVDVKDDSLYVTFMGSDFLEEGRKAGRWLVENSKGKPGPINIVELQGTVGSAPAIDRKKGFEEIIKADPRFKVIRSQTGDFTRAKGKEVMEAFLKSDAKNINVLYAHNDDMAIGAIQAIEEAGLKPGQDITIISIDGVKGAFEAMMQGKLNVTVECSPLLGPQLMSAVNDVVAGKPLPKRIVTQESIFPKEVAAQEFSKRKY
jgi:galactofuranose transport system substrate-binding protein